MLFLLNRVDAFYRDKNPDVSLKKFKEDITAQIQEKLKRVLPDHKEDIEKIKLGQICPLPALWAVEADRLWEEPEKQAALLETVPLRTTSKHTSLNISTQISQKSSSGDTSM